MGRRIGAILLYPIGQRAVDPTTNGLADTVGAVIQLSNGLANACDLWCIRVWTFINMTSCIVGRIVTGDVTLRGTFYHGFFRHLGRYITFMFCAGTFCRCIQTLIPLNSLEEPRTMSILLAYSPNKNKIKKILKSQFFILSHIEWCNNVSS
jgi:hypothetical protein